MKTDTTFNSIKDYPYPYPLRKVASLENFQFHQGLSIVTLPSGSYSYAVFQFHQGLSLPIISADHDLKKILSIPSRIILDMDGTIYDTQKRLSIPSRIIEIPKSRYLNLSFSLSIPSRIIGKNVTHSEMIELMNFQFHQGLSKYIKYAGKKILVLAFNSIKDYHGINRGSDSVSNDTSFQFHQGLSKVFLENSIK